MDDDYESWKEGDRVSAIYAALDRLEELYPAVLEEPWYQFPEKAVDDAVKGAVQELH
jgi:hypothetical protein